jgi:HSP20 family molecular chaperone IbpA
MFGVPGTYQGLEGIIPRACKLLFELINKQRELVEELTVKCSFLEIYKEVVKDLLIPANSNLKIREHATKGVWIENLSEVTVGDEQEVLNLLRVGEKSRTIGQTQMNQVSSRSHSLFIISVHQLMKDKSTKTSKLNLADLAGNEKVNKTGATGDSLEEAKKINQSLSTLGNCINAITKKTHVPYRDSKLTFILKDSLGGNAKTSLVLTCSPHAFNIEETLSTLRFGKRASSIVNTVKINQRRSNEELEALVTKLEQQVVLLKEHVKKLESELGRTVTPPPSPQMILVSPRTIAPKTPQSLPSSPLKSPRTPESQISTPPKAVKKIFVHSPVKSAAPRVETTESQPKYPSNLSPKLTVVAKQRSKTRVKRSLSESNAPPRPSNVRETALKFDQLFQAHIAKHDPEAFITPRKKRDSSEGLVSKSLTTEKLTQVKERPETSVSFSFDLVDVLQTKEEIELVPSQTDRVLSSNTGMDNEDNTTSAIVEQQVSRESEEEIKLRDSLILKRKENLDKFQSYIDRQNEKLQAHRGTTPGSSPVKRNVSRTDSQSNTSTPQNKISDKFDRVAQMAKLMSLPRYDVYRRNNVITILLAVPYLQRPSINVVVEKNNRVLITGHHLLPKQDVIYYTELLEKNAFSLEINSIPADFKILAKEISIKYRRGCFKIQLRKKKQPINGLVLVRITNQIKNLN